MYIYIYGLNIVHYGCVTLCMITRLLRIVMVKHRLCHLMYFGNYTVHYIAMHSRTLSNQLIIFLELYNQCTGILMPTNCTYFEPFPGLICITS